MKRSDFLQRMIGVALLGKLPISELILKRKVYLLHCFVAGFRYKKYIHPKSFSLSESK